MLETEAVVVRVGGGEAYVETFRASSCGSCSSKQSCGTSTLAQILGGKAKAFKVVNSIDAMVGERVVVGLEESALLRSSLLAYLLPLGLLVAGAVVGGWAAAGAAARDAYSALGAGLGLVVGYAALKGATAMAREKSSYQPVILRRVLAAGIVEFGQEGD